MNNVKLWNARPDEKFDIWLDHTRLTAIHTCPRWGLVRYIHNRTLGETTRELPLEAGEAMHQAFAAHRLWLLWQTVPATVTKQNEYEHGQMVHEAAERIFGRDRWLSLCLYLNDEDPSRLCLEVLNTSGYYDDPRDNKRTLSNMEQSLLYYLQRYDPSYGVYVEDDFVGIEIPIRIGIEFEDGVRLLYTGRVDGVTLSGAEPCVDENKTSSNVSNNWEMQWYTSHQITGYTVGVSLILNKRVSNARVIGLNLPIFKTFADKSYNVVYVKREMVMVAEWLKWVRDGYDMYARYKDTPFDAPMRTHSCYRYFRPCSFVPICDRRDDEAMPTLDEMTLAPWHPTGEE